MYAESQRRISLDADSSIGIYTGPAGMPGSTQPNYGKQYCFVKVTGVHQAGLVTAAADVIVGVLQNKPQHPGTGAEVCFSGVTPIKVGTGGVTAGQAVKADANGNAVTATVGTDSVAGVALETASAGGFAAVLLTLTGK